MKEKYEYVAIYDLDETILTRKTTDDTKNGTGCYDTASNCKSNKTLINIYDYIKELIDKNYKKDKTKLRSVIFRNAFYLPPEFSGINLIENLKSLINNKKYPTQLIIKSFEFYLQIEEKNIEHINKLINYFNNLNCLNLNAKVNNFDRIFYYITDIKDRWPKSIHYTDNVKAVFSHYSLDKFMSPKKNLEYLVDEKHGFLSHFRHNSINEDKIVGSIMDLNIDFDYVKYLMNFLC